MFLKPSFPALAAFVLALAVGIAGEYGIMLEQQRIMQDQRNRAMSAIGQYRAALESELNATLYLANGLIAYVTTHSTLEPKVVNPMLQTLYDQGRHLRSIGLAPGNRLTYVYPLKGNEKAAGLYYPDLPDQWPAVERAIRERQPRLAGPVQLKQGGMGFIYRVPVFIGPAGQYWGLLSTVIDHERLFAKAGVAPEVDGLQLALRGKDGAGPEGETFMGDAALFATDALKATINTPGGSWLLAVRPIGGWTAGERLGWLRVGAWGLGILLGMLVYYVLAIAATRAAAIRRLAEGEEKLRGLYEMSPLGILMTDMKGRFIEFNEAFRSICGYTADELKALDYWTLTPKQYETDERLQLDSLKSIGHYGPYEKECIRKDGTLVPLRANGMLISGTDGQQCIWSFVEDITDRRKAEQELLRAKRDAEAANLAKSQFLATMSHEIRTPLHVIIGLGHLLRRDIGDPVQQERLERICATSDHLLAIVNDILDLSKIEAHQLVLDYSDFKLGAVVDKVVRMVEGPAHEKGLALTIDIPPRLRSLALNGDVLRLAQTLINLCGNAVKFTDRGTVRLSIACVKEDTDSVTLHFTVEDTGIGIAPADLARLFQPFTQADSSLTRERGGTGLGLAISQRLVALMGGTIEADSQPEAGSTFCFELTLPRATASVAEASAAPAVPAATDFRGKRVLIVEDHPFSQEIIFRLLEHLGCEADVAADGVEAVERAQRQGYDLILMDMQMPRMDGLTATRAIRTLPEHCDTPIVALTANAFADDRQRCLDAGMDGHLGKPVTPTTLAAALSQWLGKAIFSGDETADCKTS